MRASERGAFVVVLGAAALLLSACQIIAGLDDYKVAPTGASGSGGDVPVPVMLAAAHGLAPVVAVGGERLFWGHLGPSEGGEMDGELWSLNVGDADPKPTLFAKGVNPRGVASDGVTLYWTDVKKVGSSYTKGIEAASVNYTGDPSKAPLLLYHVFDDAAEDIAVTPGTDGFLYWSIPSKNSIIRAPSVGGPENSAVKIASTSESSNFAIDDEYIYYFSNGQVVRRTLYKGPDEAPSVLATGVTEPGDIAVDDHNVYWSVYNADGFVYQADKHGNGQNPVKIANEQRYPYEIAVDEHHIYWGNQGGKDCSKSLNGAVMRRPKTMEQPEEIQSPIKCPSNFAMDENSVYWAGSGSIFRFAK